jgi:hypothetical protein
MRRTPLRRRTPIRAGVALTASKAQALVRKTRLRAVSLKASKRIALRAKPKPLPTAQQLERWKVMRSIGCIACRMNRFDHAQPVVPRGHGRGISAGKREIHHLTSGGRRLAECHDATILLCRWHHQGDVMPWAAMTVQEATDIYGPSFGRGRKPFEAHYGNDQKLMAYQNDLIERRLSCD